MIILTAARRRRACYAARELPKARIRAGKGQTKDEMAENVEKWKLKPQL